MNEMHHSLSSLRPWLPAITLGAMLSAQVAHQAPRAPATVAT